MTHTTLPPPHSSPDRGLRWTFLSSTNIFLMTLGGGRARLCPRAWIAPNRCWGRGRGMLFPARDFLLKFKREGSFQSPLKMYFSPLNNGLLSAPEGTRLRSRFCCRRGETSGFRARKTQLRKGLFPAPVIFAALHPSCIHPLRGKKKIQIIQNYTNEALIALPRCSPSPPHRSRCRSLQ